MVLAFGGGAAVAVPLLLLTDPRPVVLQALAAGHLAASLALVKPCRALFLALDYLLDPSEEPSGPGRGPEPPEEPASGPAPAPRGRRTGSRRGRPAPEPEAAAV